MDGNGKHCRIFLEADEYADIERIAARRGMTAEDWIADVAREARAGYYKQSERIKQATGKALQCQHPTADIEQMLAEIEAGYLSYDLS